MNRDLESHRINISDGVDVFEQRGDSYEATWSSEEVVFDMCFNCDESHIVFAIRPSTLALLTTQSGECWPHIVIFC